MASIRQADFGTADLSFDFMMLTIQEQSVLNREQCTFARPLHKQKKGRHKGRPQWE